MAGTRPDFRNSRHEKVTTPERAELMRLMAPSGSSRPAPARPGWRVWAEVAHGLPRRCGGSTPRSTGSSMGPATPREDGARCFILSAMDGRGGRIATDPTAPEPRGALLIGSVPMASAEAVFRAVAGRLGDRLRRIPDGETGERILFAGWQVRTFARHPDFEPVPGRRLMEIVKRRRLRAGVHPASVHFAQL